MKISNQHMRGLKVNAPFCLAECCKCWEVFPSNQLKGAARRCPHCNAPGIDTADLGAIGSVSVAAWNYQQKRIEALLDELETQQKNLNSINDKSHETMKEADRVREENSTKIAELQEQLCALEESDLVTICAETYQVVGLLSEAIGVFNDPAIQKVMDNLAQQKLVHSDVLPFALPVMASHKSAFDSWWNCPKVSDVTVQRMIKNLAWESWQAATFVSKSGITSIKRI